MKVKLIILLLLQFSITEVYAQTDTVSVFSRSYVYESNKDYSKAIESLMTIYSNSNYTINLRLGYLWFLKGDYTKSQMYYKNAIAAEAKSIEARLGYVQPAAALENWRDVSGVYKEILNIDPCNATANYRLAYIYHHINRDNVTALNYVTRVLKLYPFDFDANYLMAAIQKSLGNIPEARMAAQRALQFNPQSEDAQKLHTSLK